MFQFLNHAKKYWRAGGEFVLTRICSLTINATQLTIDYVAYRVLGLLFQEHLGGFRENALCNIDLAFFKVTYSLWLVLIKFCMIKLWLIVLSYSDAKSGIYTISDGENGEMKVYCQMSSVAGCSGGGWTMVMKIDGSKVRIRSNFMNVTASWCTCSPPLFNIFTYGSWRQMRIYF